MNRVCDEELMLYHDAELDSERAMQVAHELECDPALAERFSRLNSIGNAVRCWAEQQAPLESNIDRIMAQVERAESARPRTSRRSRPIAPWIMAAGAVALAASIVLVVRARMSVPDTHPPPKLAASASPLPSRAVQAARASEGPAIESVDFGMRSGVIFMVPVGGSSTPVVWLTDEVTAAQGRDKSL